MTITFAPQDVDTNKIDTMDVFGILRDVAQASSVAASTATPWMRHSSGCHCTLCR